MTIRFNTHAGASPWQGHLLCRRYAAVFLNQVEFEAPENGSSLGRLLIWGLGLPEGQGPEVLGVWSGDVPCPWAPVLDDISARGVEEVRLVVLDAEEGAIEMQLAQLPGADPLPRSRQFICRKAAARAPRSREAGADQLEEALEANSDEAPLVAIQAGEALRWRVRRPVASAGPRVTLERGAPQFALAPALRREVLSGDGIVAAVRQSLRRSIARHGPFDDEESAVSFVMRTLARSLRRHSREPDEVVAGNLHRHAGLGTRMPALGV